MIELVISVSPVYWYFRDGPIKCTVLEQLHVLSRCFVSLENQSSLVAWPFETFAFHHAVPLFALVSWVSL